MKKTTALGVVTLLGTTVLGTSQVFAQDTTPTPGTTETPVTATFTVTDDNANVELPDTSTDGDHDKNPEVGLFGIAYQPKAFNASAQLQSSGEQKVDLSSGSSNNNFHVGVKDSTKAKHSWTLKANLEWTSANKAYLDGSTIEIAGGEAKKNNSGGLIATDEVTAVANTANIGTTQEELMKSVSTKTMNGVYDYGFTSAKLVIPDTSSVAGGTYNGKVNWNLSLAE